MTCRPLVVGIAPSLLRGREKQMSLDKCDCKTGHSEATAIFLQLDQEILTLGLSAD
jgi:hypothetical protein